MATGTDKATEKELQRLRRLPENKVCPNCGRKDTMFGFSAVCWQFKTFVCGECKSAHQSFSHRCKSVSMSNWDMNEVRQLEEKSGGGNKLAYERWVSRAPASAVPDDKSSLDTIKRFIDKAYNQKMWEGPTTGSCQRGDDRDEDRRGSRREAAGPQNHIIGGGAQGCSDSPERRSAPEPMPAPPRARAPAPVAAPPAPAAQVANLLDMFDEPLAAPAPQAQMTQASQPAFDPSAFAPQPASFDPLAAGAPSAAAPAPFFDPFALAGGVAPQASPAAAVAPSVDPFAAGFGQPPQQQHQQQQEQAASPFPFTTAQHPQQTQHGMGASGGSAFGFLGGSYAGIQAPNPHMGANVFAGVAPMGGAMGMGAMQQQQQLQAQMQGGMGAAGWQRGQQQNPHMMMQMQMPQQLLQMPWNQTPMHQPMAQLPHQVGNMFAGAGGGTTFGMQVPSAPQPSPQQAASSNPVSFELAATMFDPFAPAGAGTRALAVHA